VNILLFIAAVFLVIAASMFTLTGLIISVPKDYKGPAWLWHFMALCAAGLAGAMAVSAFSPHL
jgi:hypothetical protein